MNEDAGEHWGGLLVPSTSHTSAPIPSSGYIQAALLQDFLKPWVCVGED